MLKTHSLTTRILIPLILSATLAASAVAWSSWTMGRRWAMREMSERFRSIESALNDSTFPLTPAVLKSLCQLTGTQWITVDRAQSNRSASLADKADPASERQTVTGTMVTSQDRLVTQPLDAATVAALSDSPSDLAIGSDLYFAFAFERRRAASERSQTQTVIVLFEKSKLDAVARRAAFLPLLTGFSTIGVVSTLMFFSVTRLIGRLRRLESHVDRIAGGEFESELTDDGPDEVGRLAEAISKMAGQLHTLWTRVNRQQGEKLLHQISGGMAHQLRNTLTGARMAMELHQGNYRASPPEEVRVAIRQLEIAEDYVSRLLALGSDNQQIDQPQLIGECLDDIRITHQPIARHLRVELEWSIETSTQHAWVKDGPSLSAAVSNLVLNAMQAGTHVKVAARAEGPDTCVVSVTDNGGGIDDSIAENLFEPFVTSKPEGLGLGLPLVKRTAEALGGSIAWRRQADETTFELTVSTTGEPSACRK